MKTPKSNPLPRDEFHRMRRHANESKLALCEQDADGRVVHQNQRCRVLCGRKTGTRCVDGCKLLLGDFAEHQLQLLRNVVVHGECVELAGVRMGKSNFVVMEFHSRRYRRQFSALKQWGLTPAEERVVRMRIAGFPLEHIARALGVARTTVKTHLLHAYQKIPADLARKLLRSG